MLNQEGSQIIDERYRWLVEEVTQANGSFNFDTSFTGIFSEDIISQHSAAIRFRRYFSIPKSKCPSLYGQKLTLRLINLSQQQQYPQLEHQALWTLINLAYNRWNHRLLIANGVVPLFISLIHHENASFSRLVVWGLGNIACGFQSKILGKMA